ncbi:hypothetical protein LPTSP4_03290 [Leptospira ryugenii]|uniref:Uncharacterized protein n=1 Tax=Leptospira ryugenii TaxID=1917863 RepID=A0A2P2DW14_9LEPT|nr:hypothetical protein LPTSP4_03290 [Leptospira ryugenii]
MVQPVFSAPPMFPKIFGIIEPNAIRLALQSKIAINTIKLKFTNINSLKFTIAFV